MKNYLPQVLAGIMLCLAVFLMVEQKLSCSDTWFAWEDFWHHEPLIACCFVAALALVAGKYMGKR